MGVDAAAKTPWLSKDGVVHEVVIAIAEGGVGGKIGDGGIPTSRPWGLAQRVGEANGGCIVAGQVGVSHGLIAVVLRNENKMSTLC